MAYIDTKYIGECETCRHHKSGKCDTWCDGGESYQPDMTKIPTADVVEIEMLRDWLWEIALNSVGCDFVGDFSMACQDIISRLDGLKRFAQQFRQVQKGVVHNG